MRNMASLTVNKHVVLKTAEIPTNRFLNEKSKAIMSDRRNQRKLKTQRFQKEQVTLLRIQDELSTLLEKINHSLNTLKVEELQLKSSIIGAMTKKDWVPALLNVVLTERPDQSPRPEQQQQHEAELNSQELDLDLFIRGAFEEEEEMEL